MGIEIVKTENNRKIFAYNFPSYHNVDEKVIGNKVDDFEILQVLGEGSYGFVAKVRSKINSKIYALKKANFKVLNELEKSQALNELKMLNFFDHPNVCNCLTSFGQDDSQYIVMHLFNNKDLFQYLSANCKLYLHISEENIWNIFYQCLEGLIYIHKQGVIHRDIKPGNIFMDDKGNIKIGDFGISAVMNLEKAKQFTNDPQEQQKLLFKNEKGKGTQNFMAPEVEVENGEIYDQKADVYSMGVCFYCLCFYNLPYINGNNMNELCTDSLYSPELKQIIFLMIQKDKNQRPNSMDIYGLFRQSYISKYVKNSGLCSVVQCLFNFPNFVNFFTNQNEISSIMKAGYNKKIALTMISVIQSINNNERIDKNIFALRKILNEEGIKKKDNEEISPLTALNFILKALNYELDDNINKGKGNNQGNYIHDPDIPGEELEEYIKFINKYEKNFNSLISKNFSGIFKIIRKCYDNHTNYMFRIFNFIPFNCDILCSQIGNNGKINIYKCFEIYNHKSKFFDFKKLITCRNCKRHNRHDEYKVVYETPQNLIITFERGKKSKNLIIEFDEIISFNKSQVQKNSGIKYILMGIIAENNNVGNDKYSLYLKKENNWFIYNYERGPMINFNFIKSNLNVICLFYYQNLNEQIIPNISMNNGINNYNNANNFINGYIYNQNNMNLDEIKRISNRHYQPRNNNVMNNENIDKNNNLFYMNFNRNQINNNDNNNDKNSTYIIMKQSMPFNNNNPMEKNKFNQMDNNKNMNNIGFTNNSNLRINQNLNNNNSINNPYNNMMNNNNMNFMNNMMVNNNMSNMNNNNYMNNNNMNTNNINMMNAFNGNNNNNFNGNMNNQINNNDMNQFNQNFGFMKNNNNIFNNNNGFNNNNNFNNKMNNNNSINNNNINNNNINNNNYNNDNNNYMPNNNINYNC